ncbi:MAG TPA: hypothetical protein VF079_08895 [Sphingomicrobium sp.]
MRPSDLPPVLLLLALAACNMAMSDHPMFAADERLTTPLKNGLWAADDPDCAVDVTLPTDKWPECAFWAVVGDNQVIDVSEKKADRPAGFLIAGGRPPIVQIEMIDKERRVYFFYAVEPLASAPSSPATALNLWAVACGTAKVPGSTGQIDPYPGLDKDCRPASKEALRAAAAASRAAQDRAAEKQIMRMHWVRAEPR